MTRHIHRWDCSAGNGFELIELDRAGYFIMLGALGDWWMHKEVGYTPDPFLYALDWLTGGP